ncbi:MAG: cupin domain-containing protein [Armatimonas sp.]
MSRPYVRRRAQDNSWWYMGHLSTVLAMPEDTDGSMGVFDVTIRAGMEPPPHVHSREVEAIFLLDGYLEGFAGNQRLCAGPGELVNLPMNQPHGWKITAGNDGVSARGLVIAVPGAFGHYFRRFSEPCEKLALPDVNNNAYQAKMQADIGGMIADAAEFGIEWMPPGYMPPTLQTLPARPACLNVLGEQFQPLALSGETGGHYAAMIWTSPAQSQLPCHRHEDADEAFYVLEGRIAIQTEDDFWVIAEPGDFVFLPRGVAHRHNAAGGAPARAFQLLTPGGVEGGLAEVAALPPQEINFPALAEIAERYRLTLLPG